MRHLRLFKYNLLKTLMVHPFSSYIWGCAPEAGLQEKYNNYYSQGENFFHTISSQPALAYEKQ